MNADRQRIKMLEDELLMAVRSCDEQRREVTRLTTAYDNLRGVVNSQYNELGTLEHERNEARRKLMMCSETLRDADEVKEDFQRERDEALEARDEAQETIAEMRAEGCAAVGVLENIFNGVTAEGVNHGDRTIAKTASVVADALVNVPRCEHKAERDAAVGVLKALFEADVPLPPTLVHKAYDIIKEVPPDGE